MVNLEEIVKKRISRRDFAKYLAKGAISIAILPSFITSCGKEKVSKSSTYPYLPGSSYKIGPYFTTLNKTVKPVLPLPEDGNYYPEDHPDLGKYSFGEGENIILRDDPPFTRTDNPQRAVLLYFVHLSDIHLTDEESPMRMVDADAKGATQGAYRRQSMYSTQVLNSVVRTINHLAKPRKFDFVILTGDLIDNDEYVELRWLIDIMDGKAVNPDTGKDDDPVPGPANDFNDPFQAWGLDKNIPWYAVIGNHDLGVQGTFFATEYYNQYAVGDTVYGGSQDGSKPDATKIRSNTKVPSDPKRHLLGTRVKDYQDASPYISEFFKTSSSPVGHGFRSKDDKVGFYTVDPGKGFIRIIAMDTYDIKNGGADGYMSRDQWENLVIPAIEQARKDKKLVILTSHHASYYMKSNSEVSGEEIVNTLLQYPHVILHLVGHGHLNRIDYHINSEGTNGYWEIQTSSLIDFPQQGRIIEIVYNGDGTDSIFTVMLDHNSPEGCMSYRSRELALLEMQIGDATGCGPGKPEDRNTELIFKVPDEIRQVIESKIDQLEKQTAAETFLKEEIT